MGYRTVVMLNNDYTHEWSKDPKLGEKIQFAMNFAMSLNKERAEMSRLGNYGRVVECVHADTQTLVMLDRYTQYDHLATGFRRCGPCTEEDTLQLLKEAADKHGYKLVKKSVKKS